VLKSSDGKQQLVYDCGAFRPQADTSDQIEILLTAAGETMKAAGETQSIITGRALQEAWGKRDYRAMERIIVDYRCNHKYHLSTTPAPDGVMDCQNWENEAVYFSFHGNPGDFRGMKNGKSVLALLNSKLLFWRLERMSNLFRGGWITCTKQYVGELPIREIDFSKNAEKSSHDRLVALVGQITNLKPSREAAKAPQDKAALDRQIAATDAEIDRLVYELYGLTEEEIKIVEGT